jgi:hypothetical protein
VIDRSYSRRREIAADLLGGLAVLAAVAMLTGIVVIVTHFVVKFW